MLISLGTGLTMDTAGTIRSVSPRHEIQTPTFGFWAPDAKMPLISCVTEVAYEGNDDRDRTKQLIMATSVPVSGRTVTLCPVSLVDVPVAIRRRYGRTLLETAFADGNVVMAIQLNAAIETPSDRVYWLPADSVAKVMR